MAQRIIVQDGIVNYSTSDPTLDINVNMSGLLNVTKQLTIGDDGSAPGTITTNGTQDLIISATNNVKISPTGSILLNNVAWPSTTSVSPGVFLGSSAVNTLSYYPFVIAFNSSDTLTNAALVAAYPNAVVGQSVIGPSTVYQCVGTGVWRHLSGSAGSVSSVDVSGGTTGLTTSGGPITTSGVITLGGTLSITNGGTGQTSAAQAFNALAPNQSGNGGKFLYTDGTNTSWVTADGVSIYQPVLVATSSNISLSGSSPVIDGITVPDNSRVLVRNQISTTDNGIYITSAGPWARTSDWSAGSIKYAGTQIFCTSGNTFAQSVFTLSSSTQSVVVGSGVYSFLPTVSNGLGSNYALDISRGGTGSITASGAINALVPSQTGNSGDMLSTNGTSVLWAPVVSSFNTRTGSVVLSSSDITTALTYVPLNKAGDTVSGTLTYTGGATNTGLPNPVNSTDAANKAYVDAVASGLYILASVEAATTANLSATYNNGTAGVGATLTANPAAVLPTIDGFSPAVGARILVKNQTTTTQNGIYVVTQTTSPWILTRASDYNNSIPGQVSAGTFVFVTHGTTQSSTGWAETADGTGTNNAIIIGTDSILFSQVSGSGTYTAGTGLSLTGNVFSLTNPISPTLGGTGTATAPTAGQIPIGTSGNIYTPATLTSGTAIGISSASGAITISNTGVTSAVAGTGISVSSSTGAVTFTNTGVTSITGTASQITASASTGGITLSLPSAVTLGTSLTITGNTANSFLYSGTGGLLTTTSAPTNGQILIGSTGTAPALASLTPGAGILVTPGAGSITIANTGATSVAGRTGAVVLSASDVSGVATYLGIYANTGLLPAAASNPGAFAYVGASAPYTIYVSNDNTWMSLGSSTWGAITGTLSSQTDLQTALNGKAPYLGTYATTGALPSASSNLGATAAVGSSAPYTFYVSNGTSWIAQDAFVGIFATSTALQTAFPAATFNGATAYVGASAPYTVYQANGSAWVATLSTTNIGSSTNGVTGFAGVFATVGALPAAATSNQGFIALVGSAAPYTIYISTGTAWLILPQVTAAQVAAGATAGVLALNSSGSGFLPNGAAFVSGTFVTQSLSTNYTLQPTDSGKLFYCTAALTITVPVGGPSVMIDCPSSGLVTVSSDGTSTLNGSTASVTRSRLNNPTGFAIINHIGDGTGSFGVGGG